MLLVGLLRTTASSVVEEKQMDLSCLLAGLCREIDGKKRQASQQQEVELQPVAQLEG